MKIVAVSGSLRAASSNTALVRAIGAMAPADVEFSIYNALADLPHYSPELDGQNPPAPVKKLRELLQTADGALLCTPEYAFGMPGSFKNALDWLVSSGELWRKPVAAISASPSAKGGENAHAALLLTLSALEAETVLEASLQIPFVRTKLDGAGQISDPATEQALQAALKSLIQAINDARTRNLAL